MMPVNYINTRRALENNNSKAHHKIHYGNFLGDVMDKNPANAGDEDSISWSGKIAHTKEQPNPCTITTEPVLKGL